MKNILTSRIISVFLLLTIGLAIIWSCKKDDPTPPPSTEKIISEFSFAGIVQGASVTINGDNITIAVPYNTDITALAPTIELPKGATISPASGTKQDFTKPVTYIVTAEDGTKKTYTVTVTKGNAPKSSSKEINSFVFKAFTPAIAATIDSAAKTITATLPATADLTKLTPETTFSDKATVSPASGVVQDFSKNVTYTVTAEDGSTKAFVVSVKKEAEVAVNPNDLPDFEGCLIKRVKVYSPANEYDQFEYTYKDKKLFKIYRDNIYISSPSQGSKPTIYDSSSIKLRYGSLKLDYLDINNDPALSIFYKDNKTIEYINFRNYSLDRIRKDYQYNLFYLNEKVNKIIYQEFKKDVGEYIKELLYYCKSEHCI